MLMQIKQKTAQLYFKYTWGMNQPWEEILFSETIIALFFGRINWDQAHISDFIADLLNLCLTSPNLVCKISIHYQKTRQYGFDGDHISIVNASLSVEFHML